MPVALRQRACLPDDSGDWLAVDEAAALAGGSVRSWRRRAAWEAQAARHKGRESLAVQAAPRGGKGKFIWWVHRSIDSGLTRHPSGSSRDERARPSLLTKYPSHAVDRAYRAAHWLGVWRGRCDRRRPGQAERSLAAQVVAEAKRIEGDDFPISVRALQRWQHEAGAIGPDGRVVGVEGLIDRRTATGGGGGDPGDGGRDQGAIDWLYSLYRTENKLSAKMCHEATLREARRNHRSRSTLSSAKRDGTAAGRNPRARTVFYRLRTVF